MKKVDDIEDFQDIEDICNNVKNKGGIMTVSMGDLRDAYGVAKLGIHVLNSIEEELSKRAIKIRGKLTLSQWDYVRLYHSDSEFNKLVEAYENLTEDSDNYLRKLTNKNEEECTKLKRKISEIKDIVDDIN